MCRVVLLFLALVFSAPSLGQTGYPGGYLPDTGSSLGWSCGAGTIWWRTGSDFKFCADSATSAYEEGLGKYWTGDSPTFIEMDGSCEVLKQSNANTYHKFCPWTCPTGSTITMGASGPDVSGSTNVACYTPVDPCEANPNAPECQACYPLQSDQWSTDLAQIYGYDDEEFCTPEYLSDEQECQNVLGYANDAQVCIDDQESCTAQGGSYGTIAYGDGTPEAVCIPADYGDDVPTCDIGTVNVVIPELDGFGFACSEPLDPPLPDDPTDEDVIDQDTDGDGVPDRSDPDIDGDGIPNSQDPDIDGDGVPNEDETDSDNNGQVSGGLTCSSRPSCSGDPVNCSIVLQTWSTRCEAKEIGQGIDRLQAAVLGMKEALETGLSADGFDPNAEAISDSEPSQDTFDFSSDISNIYNQGGATGSCPADTIVNTSFGQIAIPWTMLCEFASTIRPLVIFLFGLAAFRMTMRAF